MTSPTHALAGGLIAEIILWLPILPGSRKRRLAGIGIAAFLLGIASHLALDFAPHYNWAVYMDVPRDVPHGLYRYMPPHLFWPGVFALAAMGFSMVCGRERPGLTAAALLGALYPDIEKVLFFGGRLPREFVVFKQHSTVISNRTGDLPLMGLMSAELILIMALAVGIFVAHHHRQGRKEPGST